MVLMAMGKKVMSTITTTLGKRPKPNQTTRTGAMAMMGMACDAIT